MSEAFHAACSCGRLRFDSPRGPILQLTCHCTQCRQVAGTPSTNFVFFKRDGTEVTGEAAVAEFVADSGARTVRESCASCGDMLLDRTDGFPKIVGVVAERLTPAHAFQPRCHVWLESRVADVELPAGVAGFERGMA